MLAGTAGAKASSRAREARQSALAGPAHAHGHGAMASATAALLARDALTGGLAGVATAGGSSFRGHAKHAFLSASASELGASVREFRDVASRVKVRRQAARVDRRSSSKEEPPRGARAGPSSWPRPREASEDVRAD